MHMKLPWYLCWSTIGNPVVCSADLHCNCSHSCPLNCKKEGGIET